MTLLKSVLLWLAVTVISLHCSAAPPGRIGDFALLDQLSGGRLDFGIGRGYLPHEFAGHAVDGDDASGRREEAFEIITRAWAGETFSYDGAHFSFPKLNLHPTPWQNLYRSGWPVRAPKTASSGAAATVSTS